MKPLAVNTVTTHPKRFAVIWSILILVISLIPLFYGYSHTPSQSQFMGYTANPMDTNQYLSWMVQVRDGHWLFKNPYTLEHHKRIFFQPLFLILGKLAALFNVPNVIIYQICRILCGVVLLLVCYRFICHFVEDSPTRLLAFVLLSVSGGFSWLNWIVPQWGFQGYPLYSSTFRAASNTFWSLYYNPLFSLSILLLILCLLSYQKFMESEKYRYAFRAGILLLFLVQLHPFDIFIPIGVLSLQMVIMMIKLRRIKYKWVVGFCMMAMIASPYVAYLKFTLLKDPVFNHWSHMVIWPPTIGEYFFMYGFLLVFSVFAVPGLLKHLDTKKAFLLSWLLFIPVMVLLPTEPPNIPTRLIEGYHVVLSLLTALAFFRICSRFGDRFILKGFFITGTLILLSLGNIWVLARDMGRLEKSYVEYYLPEKMKRGLDWLKLNTQPEEAVLASMVMGMYIPAMSGNRVFFGHVSQSVEFFEKKDLVSLFFGNGTSDSERINVFKSWRIRYLYYGPLEEKLGGYNPEASPYLTPVFENTMVKIFRFEESKTIGSYP